MSRRRNVSLDAELSDDPENFDADMETPLAPAPVAPVDVVPAAPVADPAPLLNAEAMAAFAKLLADAIASGTQGAIERTKPVVREVESEQRSIYNPEGNTVPRPELECPTYIGMFFKERDHEPPSAIYDYDEAQCTNDEIRALNTLQAGRYMVRMHDGRPEPCWVYVRTDAGTGRPFRKIVAFPRECFDKSRWNMIPNVRVIAEQVAGATV